MLVLYIAWVSFFVIFVINVAKQEKKLINYSYYQEMPQTQIAEKMGISQVQVSRIEKKAKETIRRNMA